MIFHTLHYGSFKLSLKTLWCIIHYKLHLIQLHCVQKNVSGDTRKWIDGDVCTDTMPNSSSSRNRESHVKVSIPQWWSVVFYYLQFFLCVYWNSIPYIHKKNHYIMFHIIIWSKFTETSCDIGNIATSVCFKERHFSFIYFLKTVFILQTF